MYNNDDHDDPPICRATPHFSPLNQARHAPRQEAVSALAADSQKWLCFALIALTVHINPLASGEWTYGKMRMKNGGKAIENPLFGPFGICCFTGGHRGHPKCRCLREVLCW